MKFERPEKVNIELPDVIKTEDLEPWTRELLETFGLDAPSRLNAYACAVEDALIKAVELLKASKQKNERFQALLEEHDIPH